jgi:hypoxia up-regulated 1
MSETPGRNTHTFKRSDGNEWTNEELVAMQFSYVKELAESVGGEKVRDAVVTVSHGLCQTNARSSLQKLTND